MPREKRTDEECRADPVTYWAVQGGSGWLNILCQQQYNGVIFSQQAEDDLIFLRAVLDNVIRHNRGEQCLPLPGGASGSIASHFNQLRK